MNVSTSHLCLALLICSLVSAGSSYQSRVNTGPAEPQIVMRPVNLPGMPARIVAAAAENDGFNSAVHWTMFNSGDELTEIELQVFLFDSKGNLTETETTVISETIAAGSTRSFSSSIGSKHSFSSSIRDLLAPEGQAFVAITRSMGQDGVWSVEPSQLELAVKAKLKQQDLDVAVKYETHIRLSSADRSEIFKLAVESILNEYQNSDLIDSKGRVFVSEEGIDFPLPQVRGASLIAADSDKIKKVAVKREGIRYLTCDPWTVEGSQVFASISIEDRPASQTPKISIISRLGYSFTCTKKNGEWIVETSNKYS